MAPEGGKKNKKKQKNSFQITTLFSLTQCTETWWLLDFDLGHLQPVTQLIILKPDPLLVQTSQVLKPKNILCRLALFLEKKILIIFILKTTTNYSLMYINEN